MPPVEKKRIAYFYDNAVGDHAYELGHPMKPFRIRLTHSLVMHYGLYKDMDIYRARPATRFEMTQFHTDDYINFLYKVTPDNMKFFPKELDLYNVGIDSPIFDGLFDFCSISAGGSMEGAGRLNRQKCDIAINWAGGLHHAKKGEASGFCYVNDAVLGILELLRFHTRVLYIDIDVHHGDGVEEAFYTTDRVMTVSLHKYGEFFPGTGDLNDIGVGQGKYHAINVPLRDGVDDAAYKGVFEPVITAVMKYYQPEAIVLQCGADSLSGDRLGPFNLSMAGHANCVTFVQNLRMPTLVLGGGGYTIRNVARAWAFETGELLGAEMDPVLPYNEYYSHYGPDFELDVKPANAANLNSPEYLSRVTAKIIDYLRCINPVPSVEMMDIPPGLSGMDDEMESQLNDEDEDDNPDVRHTIYRLDKRIANPNELESDSDDDFASLAYGIQRQAKSNGKRNRTDVNGLVGLSSPTKVDLRPVTSVEDIVEGIDELHEEDNDMADAGSEGNLDASEQLMEVGEIDEVEAVLQDAAESTVAPPASPSHQNGDKNHFSPPHTNGGEKHPIDME